LLVGVEDRTRHVRGVADPLSTEERLANLLSDNVLPRLVPELEVLPWRRTHVLAVQVYPSYSRPHYLKSAGPERGVYVRVGSSNRQADSELIAELRRFASGQSYDEEPLPDLDSEAIDFRAASELFASKRKLKKTDLDTPRIVTKHQGRKVPTVGGVLLFGHERERLFPDAWIQAGRFDGLDKVRLIDTFNIRSSLPHAVDEAIGFVQKHDLHSIKISGARHTDTWSLPAAAVREAIINAATKPRHRPGVPGTRLHRAMGQWHQEDECSLPGRGYRGTGSGGSRYTFPCNHPQEFSTSAARFGQNESRDRRGAFFGFRPDN
jgi:predicted HTH transcriptional regulator